MPEVFVIGGGPAGLAAAIAARRRGLSVTLADSRRPPIDKACGEGLLPSAIACARKLGLDFRAAESFEIAGVRFHGQGISSLGMSSPGISGDGISAASRFPHTPGLGIRRTALHAALVEAASSCGVELRWNCPVNDFESIEARWIVGADGMSSRVRSWAGLNGRAPDRRRFGFRRHYALTPWSNSIEIYWGEGVQAYVTPISKDQIGIAVLSSDPALRVEAALDFFPDLRAKLDGAQVVSVERGALAPTRRLRRVTARNVALVGDASGSVDPITADGISLGFEQALALAEAFTRGNPAIYESAHARIARRPHLMAKFMLTMDRWTWIRKRALAAMASHPHLLDGLLAMHLGESRPAEFAATCAALGLRMLA
jgi:flavin-dependent dehydrogenase